MQATSLKNVASVATQQFSKHRAAVSECKDTKGVVHVNSLGNPP